jgi:hypothetical protein
MFWCWEKHTDVSGLGREAGVAILAATVSISGERILATPRLQPLRIDGATPVLPVVRVQTSATTASFLERHVDEIASLIVRHAAHLRPGLLQIDFDARLDERPFYHRLIAAIRRQVGSDCFISMTALASWCAGDCWEGELDVDEIVPMFFSMGNGGEEALHRVERSRSLSPSAANIALGVCETQIDFGRRLARLGLVRGRRVYLFNTHEWSLCNENSCMREVRQWQ